MGYVGLLFIPHDHGVQASAVSDKITRFNINAIINAMVQMPRVRNHSICSSDDWYAQETPRPNSRLFVTISMSRNVTSIEINKLVSSF